jgi:hypothetical protein
MNSKKRIIGPQRGRGQETGGRGVNQRNKN